MIAFSTAEQVALVRNWVAKGAHWPEDSSAESDHWAFRAPQRPPLPQIDGGDRAWVRNPIDRFILSGLESMDFAHSPEADRLGG